MRYLISAALLTLALTACGGGDSSDDQSEPASTSAPSSATSTSKTEQTLGTPCDEMFVEGEPMPAEAADGCYDAASDSIVVSFPEDCADGRVLVLNPRGYGIVGDPIHVPAAGQDEPDVNSAEYKAVGAECNP